MTEEVKVFNLKINGIDSVKSLKEHISDLRDALVNLDDKSEEYSQVVDELVASQKKLNTVMGASKESLKGSEGSYNALVNEMKALKTVWRELSDEASRNEIGSRIAEINNQLKDMDSSIGNFQRNVGNYEEAIANAFMTPQQELRKLKTELASMEQGTDEYNQTFQRMAELTHNVTEQQEMLRWSSADLGDILGNLAGVAAGLAGGFSAINAVQGLIGSGNEDVERAMQTTQNWIQLIQGLEAVESLGDKITGLWEGLKNYAQAQQKAAIETEKTNMSLASNVVQTNRAATATVGFTGGLNKAIVSVKTLALSIKTALVSSGIGLLIVALGTAVSYLWKFVDGTDKAEKTSEKMGEANDKLNNSLEKSKENLAYQERLMKAQGKSYEEIYQMKLKTLQADLKEAKSTLAYNKVLAAKIGLKNLEKEKYKQVKEALEQSQKVVDELEKSIKELNNDRTIEKVEREAEARKKLAEAYKEQLDKAKELANELISNSKTEEEKIEESYQKKSDILDKYIKDEETKNKAKSELEKQRNKQYNDLEIKNEEEKYSKIRAIREKQLQLSEDDYDAQVAEAIRYITEIQDALEHIKEADNPKLELELFNAREGTAIQSVEELGVELELVEKKLKLIDSNKAFDNLKQKASTIGDELSQSLERHTLNTEEYASDQKPFERIGMSNSDIKAEMDTRYNIQQQAIQAELELWQNALDAEELMGEQKVEAMNRVNELIIQSENLTTQKMIESNNLRVENFKVAVDSMKGIADSIGSVFSSVSDIIMSNAEAQLEAGEISEEEYNKEFERAKKFQIAEAIINTISGAVGAFTGIMKSTGGWGIALAVAQMAAVLATGYAQIEQIKNTKPNSSSSNSSSSSKYAMATPSATSDFNPQLTQNATGQQETEDLANAIGKQNIWVSVTDIDNAQKQGRVRVSESSF